MLMTDFCLCVALFILFLLFAFHSEYDVPMPEKLKHPQNSCLKNTMNYAIEVDESPPHADEIKEACNMKNGKFEGLDKIKMERIKYGNQSDMFIIHLFTLLTLI